MPVKDDSLIAQYIRAIENPDSVGFNKGRWEAPPAGKGYDLNSRGFGMDVNYNDATRALTANRKGKWLTEEEERQLRLDHITDNQKTLNRWTASPYIRRNPLTEEKEAMALGMLYRGDGIRSIVRNPIIRDAYYSGSDEDMQRAVSDYYKKKNVTKRARLHDKFFNSKSNSSSKDNIPQMIRRPDTWSPAKFGENQFVPKKFADGEDLDDAWNSLSMKDKAEIMKVAIANGITSLPEIRQAYNEFAEGGNLYGKGGRKGGAVNSNSQRAMSYLLSRGMSRTGASAIVGTLQAESNLDPTIHAQMKGDNGEGIAQWTGSRKKNFWKTLEQIEPGAQRRYGSIDRVPLERQLDVVLAERPDITNAIHGAKDVGIATDIMLRGYENGGGTLGTMASKGQMDRIYGKWNNGYNNQMRRRLGNASNLLGTHFDLTSYELPKGFFDGINSQIANIPQMQLSEGMDTDPELRYKAPTIDMTLFQQPEETKAMEPVYNPRQERLEGLRNFNTVLGLMEQQSPFAALGNNSTGLLDYIGQIYS